MAPAVNAVLPPASASGARSSTTTSAPCSRAESAAQRAAFPPPTTITVLFDIYHPVLERIHTSAKPQIYQESRYLSQPSKGRDERPCQSAPPCCLPEEATALGRQSTG